MAQEQGQKCDQPVDYFPGNYFRECCRAGRYKKIEELIQTRKDFSSSLALRWQPFGYTPLHEAVSYSQPKVLKLLLQNGGDPNICSFNGCTPLHLAASSGYIDCVRVLLAYSADITIMDFSGQTPLVTAELSSTNEVARILRSAGE